MVLYVLKMQKIKYKDLKISYIVNEETIFFVTSPTTAEAIELYRIFRINLTSEYDDYMFKLINTNEKSKLPKAIWTKYGQLFYRDDSDKIIENFN